MIFASSIGEPTLGETKLNTVLDRANRINAWSTRGRDLLWLFTMIILSHLAILTIIGLQLADAFIPLSIYIVFLTIMGIMGCIDAMDDIAAVADDADDEERQTKAWKRFDQTQWGAFKTLLIGWFGLTALAELYVMWLA